MFRCAAIFGVLLSHNRGFLTPHWQHFETFRLGGFLGVEMFFVLSGFLIGEILIKMLTHESTLGFRQVKRFWVRRWMRTLPNYYLFLFINIFVAKIARSSEPSNPLAYFVFSQSLAWSHPNLFPEAWSLAIEEWFYFTFPPVLLLAALALGKRSRAFLFAAAIFIIVPTTLRVAYVLESDPLWRDVRQLVVYRMDAIMFGVLMSFMKVKFAQTWARWRVATLFAGTALVAAASVIFSVGELDSSDLTRIGLFTVTSVGFALMLPAFDGLRPQPSVLTRVVGNIALWSYSLYLVHTLVALVVVKLAARVHYTHFIISLATFLISSLASICISSLIYAYFEKPITDLREKLA